MSLFATFHFPLELKLIDIPLFFSLQAAGRQLSLMRSPQPELPTQ